MVHVGDALFSLGRFTESYNAYNSAHRLDMSNEGVKVKRELAEKAIRDGRESSSSASSSSSSSTSSTTGSIQAYLRLFVVTNAIAYLIVSFISPSLGRFCYRNFVLASVADYVLALYLVHGFPRFSMEYVQRLMMDASGMYLFLSLLLLMQRPAILAMAPLFITAFIHSAHYMHGILTRKSPDTVDRVAPMVSKYLPRILNKSESSWNSMTSSSKWRLFDDELMSAACYCEVFQGLAFILQLLFPSRNFLGTMMWWQYLQMRYMMDQRGTLKSAFAGVDRYISSLLCHPYCPQALNQGYVYVKTFLANKVRLPNPNEPAPSMSSMLTKSCTIM